MMFKILLISLFLSYNAFAEVRFYDQSGNKTNEQYLINSGAATKQQLHELNSKQTLQRIQAKASKKPDNLIPISEKSIEGLGTVVAFIDITSMNEEIAEIAKDIQSMSNVKTYMFLKQPKSPVSMISMVAKSKGKFLDMNIKVDSADKNAKDLRVTRYPVVVYIDPFKQLNKFPLTKSGYNALLRYKGKVYAKINAMQSNY